VTEAHRCKQLAQGCYTELPRIGFEPATLLQIQHYARCVTYFLLSAASELLIYDEAVALML